MNKREIGSIYEQKAQKYLEGQGYRVVERNYRCKVGEIDLISEHEGYLVFIEVKYRTDGRSGYGLDSVDMRKQRRIVRAASWYLNEKHIAADKACRFDVVSYLGDEITLIQDAFQC